MCVYGYMYMYTSVCVQYIYIYNAVYIDIWGIFIGKFQFQRRLITIIMILLKL